MSYPDGGNEILYAIIAIDHRDVQKIRADTRTRHLEFIEKHKDKVAIAGPFLNDAGESIGSFYVVRASDEAEARSFIEADPYSGAQLFCDVQIRRWRLVIDNIHAG
jgi:uncharacterized protein YciI